MVGLKTVTVAKISPHNGEPQRSSYGTQMMMMKKKKKKKKKNNNNNNNNKNKKGGQRHTSPRGVTKLVSWISVIIKHAVTI